MAQKFLEYTNSNTGKKIYINPMMVASIEERGDNYGNCWITIMGGTTHYIKETAEKVRQDIEKPDVYVNWDDLGPK